MVCFASWNKKHSIKKLSTFPVRRFVSLNMYYIKYVFFERKTLRRRNLKLDIVIFSDIFNKTLGS